MQSNVIDLRLKVAGLPNRPVRAGSAHRPLGGPGGAQRPLAQLNNEMGSEPQRGIPFRYGEFQNTLFARAWLSFGEADPCGPRLDGMGTLSWLLL